MQRSATGNSGLYPRDGCAHKSAFRIKPERQQPDLPGFAVLNRIVRPMAIFPRRQLQQMLNALGPKLTLHKANDLLGRLDSADPDQSVPAEYELAVGYALSNASRVAVSPAYGKSEPDFLSEGLFGSQAAVFEVTALSDDAFSGKAAMDKTAGKVDQFANTLRPRAGNNFHYTFLETSGYRPVKLPVAMGPWTHKSQYWRARLTSHQFELTDRHKAKITEWLKEWPPAGALRIAGEGTVFDVRWQERQVHHMLKTFSSMPSEIYDLKENALYRRLKDKAKGQLANVPAGILKCIVLGDAGCSLLSHLRQSPGWQDRPNGAAVIWEFLKNYPVDFVIILSPQQQANGFNNPRYWSPEIYPKVQREEAFYARLQEALGQLPPPQLHGHQARSWVQQGMTHPQGRGMYEPMTWGGRTVKISSRALLELLAGRMSAEQFRHFVTGDRNPFEVKLARGEAISDVRIERHGPGRDDDHIEFSFEPDPNASALQLPPDLKSS